MKEAVLFYQTQLISYFLLQNNFLFDDTILKVLQVIPDLLAYKRHTEYTSMQLLVGVLCINFIIKTRAEIA